MRSIIAVGVVCLSVLPGAAGAEPGKQVRPVPLQGAADATAPSSWAVVIGVGDYQELEEWQKKALADPRLSESAAGK